MCFQRSHKMWCLATASEEHVRRPLAKACMACTNYFICISVFVCVCVTKRLKCLLVHMSITKKPTVKDKKAPTRKFNVFLLRGQLINIIVHYKTKCT
jgi:hypothetical protein